MLKLIYIGLGGSLGAISRYIISKWIQTRWKTIFPYGTLTVNLIGSFLLGFLITFFLKKNNINPFIKIAFTTGFLGALTTFSTFSYETMILLKDNEIFFACINILSNLIFGLIFVLAGIVIAKAI